MTGHTFANAPSGRSKCRGCSASIGKDTLRFGERLPNPFGDGDMTHWHHPPCAARRRPEPFLEAVNALSPDLPELAGMRKAAEHAVAHPRLQRIGCAERAASGRARCRHCRELIEENTWRIPLIFFNDDAYASSGFIHLTCAADYCGTPEVSDSVLHFAAALSAEDLAAVDALLKAST